MRAASLLAGILALSLGHPSDRVASAPPEIPGVGYAINQRKNRKRGRGPRRRAAGGMRGSARILRRFSFR